MEGHPIRGLIVILACAILNIIASSAVTAIDNVNETNARKRAEENDKKARRLVYIIEHHKRLMTVTDLMSIIALMGIGVAYITAELGLFLKLFKADINVNVWLAALVSTISLILIIMLTELITIKAPKKLAFRHAETYAYSVSRIIRAFMGLLAPFACILEQGTRILLRIFGIKPSELEETVTEEEIISIVNEGHESGIIEAEEAEMINNIFEFDDKEVKDVMTHRKNIIAVPANLTIEEALNFMLNENYSRFPVYEENIDNIVGILHLKDVTAVFMENLTKNDTNKRILVRDIAKEPYFIPDTQNVNVLFRDMQAKKMHMAIAIDEYGQTAGIVAMEDILEEIVGDIQDEYDEEENKITREAEGVYIVHGDISLEELSDETGIEIDDEDFEDFDTFNGLLISKLDRIPEDGEKATVIYKDFNMDILDIKNKMVNLVRMTKIVVENEEEHESENSTAGDEAV